MNIRKDILTNCTYDVTHVVFKYKGDLNMKRSFKPLLVQIHNKPLRDCMCLHV